MVNNDYYRILRKRFGYLQSKLDIFGLSAESLTLYAEQPTYLPTYLPIWFQTAAPAQVLRNLQSTEASRRLCFHSIN